jgi:putative ABC transport system permease protein
MIAAAAPEQLIDPGWLGLAAGAVLMLAIVVIAAASGVRMVKQGFVATARATVQLIAVGLILGWVFGREHWFEIAGLLLLMTAIAGFTAGRRVNEAVSGLGWVFTLVLGGVTALTLIYVTQVAVGVHEVRAQYFIPLGGMILGNAMTAVVLATSRYVDDLRANRERVEAALALGASPLQATRREVQKAFLAAVTPVINAMLIAGIVKLPGVMTGTLLGGVEPLTAARYQLVVMFMLVFADGVTALVTLAILRRKVFSKAWQVRV